jgi:hypothetical protein
LQRIQADTTYGFVRAAARHSLAMSGLKFRQCGALPFAFAPYGTKTRAMRAWLAFDEIYMTACE